MERVPFNRLTLGSLGRMGLICNLSLWLPLGLIGGMPAFFGSPLLSFNKIEATGWGGVLEGVLAALFMALVGSLAMLGGAAVARAVPWLFSRQMVTLQD